MGVEVRQLVVKSNVLESDSDGEAPGNCQLEEMKRAMMDECRRLVIAMLREAKER